LEDTFVISKFMGQRWWCLSVIPAIQEAKIEAIPGKVSETVSQKVI
jgi:hypothetical protein